MSATVYPSESRARVKLSRVRLSLVREGPPPENIRDGGDVARLVRALLGDDPREHFVAVYLDARHRRAAVHVVSIGALNGAPVHPREVFAPALLHPTAAVVVAHNHPSGDPTPSSDDRLVTERLRQAGELLGIELLDHVVIGAERFYSFADESYHRFDGGRADR